MRRRRLLHLGGLVLLLGRAEIARGATILAVRVWPAPDYSRVTIESDAALKTQQLFVANPPRLAVDIEGVELNAALRELVAKVRADDPTIAGIRVGQFAPTVVRLVLDLKQAATPQVFTLPPVAAYRNRLVLDMYPNVVADPLEVLIAERARAQSGASGGASASSAARPPAGTHAGTPPMASQGSRTRTAPDATTAASTPIGSASAADPLGELIAQRAAGGGTLNPSAAAAGTSTGRMPASMPATGPSSVATTSALTSPGTSGQAPLATAGPAATAVRPPAAGTVHAPVAGTAPTGRTDRLIIIALDPGHGGEDPGAIGPSGTQEKDVVLRLAHQLRTRINRMTIGGNPMRAYLTRDADFFVPLHVRVQKARRVQADLFVSLHADAFYTPRPQGASVFALSQGGASSSAARWMADKENKADLIGGVNVNARDAEVQRALLDMSTTAQIKDSLKLGSAMLGEIGRIGKLHKPRVEQAGFAVLKAPDIPSVLVEAAFISNPEEETRLNDETYIAQLADALVRGIEGYFSRNPPLARNRAV